MKLREIRGVLEPPQGKYGVEIEVESNSFDFEEYSHPAWYQTEDPSLRNTFNTEFVLNKPATYCMVLKKIDELANDLDNKGFINTPSVRTGVHVHLNVNERTPQELMQIILVYLTLEKVLIRYCGDQREGNLFCLRASDCPVFVESIASAAVGCGWLNAFPTDIYKYSALNLCTLYKFGSIEFRSLKTPHNLSDIKEWISIIEAIEKYALGLTNLYEIPYDISYHSYDVWIKKIFGEKLMKKLYYVGMEKDIKSDMRNIQRLFHTNVAEKPTSKDHLILD